MALQVLAALGNGLFEGAKAGMQQRNPLAEAQLAASIERQRMMRPYYEATAREASVRADKGELELDNQRRLLQKQQATKFFGEFESLATEAGGYSRAMETPDGQRLFASAYNLAPEREELGLPEVDGFEAINETNFQDWGFTPEDYERMRTERQSEALFVPYRLREGRREPVLEDLDGDGTIDAYGGEQLERMVRPIFMSQERAGQEFAALTPQNPLGGTITIGGGGGQPAPRQQGGMASMGSGIGALTLNSESRGNPAAVNPNDNGGAAYGPYQFHTGGTLQDWLQSEEGSWLAGEFQGLQPGTQAFNQRWQEVASDPEVGRQITQAQQQYLERTHYTPVARQAQAMGWDIDDPRVQQALFSTATQHGGANSTEILNQAAAYLGGQPTTPEAVIDALYRAREQAYPPGSGRYTSERETLLAQPQQPQQSQQQPQSSVQALSRPAIQSAVDVATGYDPDRVPSPVERLSSGDGNLGNPNAWWNMTLSEATDAVTGYAKGVGSTVLDYAIGSDNADPVRERLAPVGEFLERRQDQLLSGYPGVPDTIARAAHDAAGTMAGGAVGRVTRDEERGEATRQRVTDRLDERAGFSEQGQPAEQPLRRHETSLGAAEGQEAEFKSALARRAVNQQGFGPGSAERAANDPAIVDETRRNLTPETVMASGQELLGGLERRDGNTFSVTSTNSRPTHKQIGHAYNMMVRGHITRDEFIRFKNTGTISEDGVALIERGMQEAASTARTAITQQQQTVRNAQDNWTELEKDERQWRRDNNPVDVFHSTMDQIGPSVYQMDVDQWNGARGNAVKQELAQGAWRFRGGLIDMPDDVNSWAQGHRRLLELEPEVQPGLIDRLFRGHEKHDLSSMPAMQALAAADSGLLADKESAEHSLRSIERYRELTRSAGNPNSRNPQHEAQALVNFYRFAAQAGENPHALDPNSMEHNRIMRAAIYAANSNGRLRTLDDVLSDRNQGSN